MVSNGQHEPLCVVNYLIMLYFTEATDFISASYQSFFSSSGDLFSLRIDVVIFSCFHHHSCSGTSICKPGSACVEEMGKEINNDIAFSTFTYCEKQI